MLIEILEHDLEAAKAQIRFTYKGVVVTQNYDLKLVVPSTNVALTRLNVTYTPEVQQTIIDRLAKQVEFEIDNGILFNMA